MKGKNTASIIPWIVLSLSICFMFCIFAPLDAYFSNIEEYWFTLGDILPVIIAVFAVAFVVISLVFFLFSHTRVSPILFAFFSVLLLFFYIQGNYIPRNYGVLNGSEIEWSKYSGLGFASVDLAIICLAIFIILIIKFRDKVFVIGKYLALFLIIIQVVTLGTTVIQKHVMNRNNSSVSTVVTDKNLLSLSGDGNNIVVFLLDTFEGEDMRNLINDHKEKCEDTLENFTWYENTLGAYPTTKGALPNILTGKWYENQMPYSEFVAKAYDESEIYPTIMDMGFTLDVYTDNRFLSHKEGMYSNVIQNTYRISEPVGFAKYFYRIVAFNYMPHQLKRFFTVDTAGFDRFRGVMSDDQAYTENVQAFYNTLIEKGIEKENRGNLIKFYHLEGVHGPSTFGSDLKTNDGENYTVKTEADGNMTLLKEMFDQMKELGIYESSSIIIMADHGHNNYCQNPIFLLKNAYETHPFEISDIEMSYEYLPTVFLELVRDNKVDSACIASQKPIRGKRRFLYYDWDGVWDKDFLPGMTEMFATGDAKDSDNLIKSGVLYIPNQQGEEYTLGEILSLNAYEQTAQPYFVYGFSLPEDKGTRTKGKECMLRMKINEKYNNLLLSLDMRPLYFDQFVKVIANDREVGTLNINQAGKYNVIIPHDYVEDGELSVKIQIVTDFNRQSYRTGISDDKLTPLFIETVSLTSTEQSFTLEQQQEPIQDDHSSMVLSYLELYSQGKIEDGRIALTGDQLQYGPYISLSAGTWKVRVEGEGLADSKYFVTANAGKIQIPVESDSVEDDCIVYRFTLEEDMENVEFLVGCSTDKKVYVDHVFLSVLDSEKTIPSEINLTFSASDLFTQGYVEDGLIVLSKNQKQYGPYIPLSAGTWEIRVDGKGLDGGKCYATADSGAIELPQKSVSEESACVVYQMTLEKNMENVEFLVKSQSDDPVFVDKVTVSKIE